MYPTPEYKMAFLTAYPLKLALGTSAVLLFDSNGDRKLQLVCQETRRESIPAYKTIKRNQWSAGKVVLPICCL